MFGACLVKNALHAGSRSSHFQGQPISWILWAAIGGNFLPSDSMDRSRPLRVASSTEPLSSKVMTAILITLVFGGGVQQCSDHCLATCHIFVKKLHYQDTSLHWVPGRTLHMLKVMKFLGYHSKQKTCARRESATMISLSEQRTAIIRELQLCVWLIYIYFKSAVLCWVDLLPLFWSAVAIWTILTEYQDHTRPRAVLPMRRGPIGMDHC